MGPPISKSALAGSSSGMCYTAFSLMPRVLPAPVHPSLPFSRPSPSFGAHHTLCLLSGLSTSSHSFLFNSPTVSPLDYWSEITALSLFSRTPNSRFSWCSIACHIDPRLTESSQSISPALSSTPLHAGLFDVHHISEEFPTSRALWPYHGNASLLF